MIEPESAFDGFWFDFFAKSKKGISLEIPFLFTLLVKHRASF